MTLEAISLKVRALGGHDQYKDMIRVHWTQRNKVGNGSIARITVNGKTHILAMRGCIDKEINTVGLDHLNREDMKLENDQTYKFTFEKARLLEKLKWALRSADPAARIATWIAIFLVSSE